MKSFLILLSILIASCSQDPSEQSVQQKIEQEIDELEQDQVKEFLETSFHPGDNLRDKASKFHSKPNERNLRKLLNSWSDGESAYLHMALLGKAFAEHPSVFKRVYEDIQTDKEKHCFIWIREYNDGIFEYHAHLEPASFDRVRIGATWLK